jgi:hypothetical protein
MPVLPLVPSMMVPARFQLPGLLGVLDHLQRHAVLDAVAGVEGFHFGQHGTRQAGGDAVQPHQRRLPDGAQDVLMDLHAWRR